MTIRKRGKKFYFTVDFTDEDGVRRRVERVGCESLRDTKKMARAAQAAADEERFLAMKAVSVERFYAQWIAEDLLSGSYKVNTVRRYQSVVRNYILPRFGQLKLQALTPRLLQNFLNDLSQTLSRSSVNSIRVVLKQSLAWAVDFGRYIPDSPADRLRVPRDFKAPEEVEIFPPDEMAAIFRRFPEGSKLYALIRLSYYTGMRLGECCALTWDNVDFSRNEIHVRGTVVNDGAWRMQDLPKTKASRRTVNFGQALSDILQNLKRRQAVDRFRYGTYYRSGNFVCSLESGEMMNPDDARYFNMWCKSEFGHGSFHSLRHTYATMLLEAGADLELVSKQLGHSSIAVTAKYYSHVLDKRRARLTSYMDAAL